LATKLAGAQLDTRTRGAGFIPLQCDQRKEVSGDFRLIQRESGSGVNAALLKLVRVSSCAQLAAQHFTPRSSGKGGPPWFDLLCFGAFHFDSLCFWGWRTHFRYFDPV